MLEIVFFIALALYFSFRLWNVLGKEHEEDISVNTFTKRTVDITDSVKSTKTKNLSKKFSFTEEDLERQKSNNMENDHNVSITAYVPQENNAILHDCSEAFVSLQEEIGMNPVKFVKIVTEVFAVVADCYTSGNIKDLDQLLSKNMLNGFNQMIEGNRIAGVEEKIFLVKILSACIVQVKKQLDYISITVHFKSKQIKYTVNSSGSVISGSKERDCEISENWEFIKQIKGLHDNWLVDTIIDA